jgi:hypothetical protein
LIGDTNYTDYGLRIIRGSGGANTYSEIIHRGTGDLAITTAEAGPILLKTAGTSRMYIAANGSVGIGTTSFGLFGILQVNGSIGLIGNTQIRQATNSDGNSLQIFATQFVAGSANSISYGYTEGGLMASLTNSDTAILLDAGRVSSTNGRVRIKNTSTDDTALSVEKNGVTTLFASTVGNVGIGTASPAYKLDVSGDTRIFGGSLGVGVVPNATDGRIDASNDIVAFSSSDSRLKENITPIEGSLNKLLKISGVEFDWKEETKDVHGYEGHDIGVIAQEIKEILPEAVRENVSGYLAVRYEKIVPLLIEAMKEQQEQIENLKTEINRLKK